MAYARTTKIPCGCPNIVKPRETLYVSFIFIWLNTCTCTYTCRSTVFLPLQDVCYSVNASKKSYYIYKEIRKICTRILCTDNSIIYGDDWCRYHAFTPSPPVDSDAVCSKVVFMLLLIHCLFLLNLWDFYVWSLVCYAVLTVSFLVLKSSC